jgi:hypothetical protein
MARLQGTLDQPVEDAKAATRRAAATQGYALAEGQGGPYMLVFKKGGSGFSWGSQLTVELAASSPSQTRLTVSIEENWAITDWGRSRRAARRLLDAMGAKH